MAEKEWLNFEDIEKCGTEMEAKAGLELEVQEKKCSYTEGYMKRQYLFSCLTCVPEAKTDPTKQAAVCMSCSYHCHEGHEVVWLHTRRNFKCDCGNRKFNLRCKLYEEKDESNEMNVYTRNFGGVCCIADCPCPDLDNDIYDKLLQCVICEDFYHLKHLELPSTEDPIEEIVCVDCVKKNDFLASYANVDGDTEENSEEIEAECTKPSTRTETISTLFWFDSEWRKKLCACDACLKMYKEHDVMFLLDSEDSVSHFEEVKKKEGIERVEKEQDEFMKSLGRTELVDMVAGINTLKEHFVEFFEGLRKRKQTDIGLEDVKAFAEKLRAKTPRFE